MRFKYCTTSNALAEEWVNSWTSIFNLYSFIWTFDNLPQKLNPVPESVDYLFSSQTPVPWSETFFKPGNLFHSFQSEVLTYAVTNLVHVNHNDISVWIGRGVMS